MGRSLYGSEEGTGGFLQREDAAKERSHVLVFFYCSAFIAIIIVTLITGYGLYFYGCEIIQPPDSRR